MGEYLEERPARSMGAKLDDMKKYNTPAPNAYNADKGQEYLEERPARSMGAKLDDLKKYNTPAPNAYNSDKGQEYLEERPAKSLGVRLEEAKKFLTPAPNAYNSEKGDEYLAEKIKHSFGLKPDDMQKYLTPAPNTYDADKGQEYLEKTPAKTMGAKLSDLKGFSTPAPSAYRPEGCNCLWHQTFSLRWISEGRCICEVEDRDSEDAGANTGGFQTQEWNLHKDRAADDHQDDQDNNPAVAASGLGSTLMARSSICTIINTFIFVITYPNLTKMKRHVWYWCLSRVPVIFLTKCLRSPHLTTLCDTDRKALIKSNSVTDVE